MSHAATPTPGAHPSSPPPHPAAHETAADKRHQAADEKHAADEKRAADEKLARDTAVEQTKLLLLLAGDWLNNDRTHSKEIAALVGAMTAAAGPPVNVDVPYVSVAGATASCTMGNWRGEPTEYAYAWQRDGVAIAGATSATYAVKPDDSGHSLACVVSATNALGTTAAPMSNAVLVA
jgi:hypothetical protein